MPLMFASICKCFLQPRRSSKTSCHEMGRCAQRRELHGKKIKKQRTSATTVQDRLTQDLYSQTAIHPPCRVSCCLESEISGPNIPGKLWHLEAAPELKVSQLTPLTPLVCRTTATWKPNLSWVCMTAMPATSRVGLSIADMSEARWASPQTLLDPLWRTYTFSVALFCCL